MKIDKNALLDQLAEEATKEYDKIEILVPELNPDKLAGPFCVASPHVRCESMSAVSAAIAIDTLERLIRDLKKYYGKDLETAQKLFFMKDSAELIGDEEFWEVEDNND